jgi:hypothetical protein
MTPGTARSAWLLAVLMHLGVIAWFSPLVIQDYPNHLARALIMGDPSWWRSTTACPLTC